MCPLFDASILGILILINVNDCLRQFLRNCSEEDYVIPIQVLGLTAYTAANKCAWQFISFASIMQWR